MFLYYFAYVPRPLDEVAAALQDAPMRWLPGFMTAACQEAAASLEQPGVPQGACVASARALLAIGPPSRRPGSIQIPVRVVMRGPRAPFRSLEADLEAAELGPQTTQVTLRGSYRATRRVGEPEDPGLLHRVAEAAGKGLVERVADYLNAATVPGDGQLWRLGVGRAFPALNV